jgi:hypothetical protein
LQWNPDRQFPDSLPSVNPFGTILVVLLTENANRANLGHAVCLRIYPEMPKPKPTGIPTPR